MAEQVEPGHVVITNDSEAAAEKMESLEALGMDYTVQARRTGTAMQGKPTYCWDITWRVPVVEGTDAPASTQRGPWTGEHAAGPR